MLRRNLHRAPGSIIYFMGRITAGNRSRQMKLLLWAAFVVCAYWFYMIILRRIYPIEDTFDEIIYADTADGWRIPLFRHRPQGEKIGKYPVI